MDDLAYLLSIQPVLCSLIMFLVALWLGLLILDFFMSLFFSWWHSPNGFKVRQKGSFTQNQTK